MEHPQVCPAIADTFHLLGKRWTGFIICALFNGAKRYSEISELVPGMTDRMIAARLKELESAEIITRQVFPEVPVKVEYELTNKGQALEPVMQSIFQWTKAWNASNQHFLSTSESC